MKKLIMLLPILLGMFMFSCQESPDVNNTNQPTQLSKIGTGLPDMFLEGVTYCGDYKTVDFWAGQTIDAGSITIYNDETNLYVTVYSEFGYQEGTEQIKMWVGTELITMPQTDKGTPIPGQFPYKIATSGGTTYTFTIPLNDLQLVNACGDLIYIVVHGDVFASNDGGTTVTSETAFGGEIPGPGPRWWFYTTFNIQCCNGGGGGFDNEETAFAKGGWVFTTDRKSNPENLPSLRLTKNRWGWAFKLAPTFTTGTYDIWAGAGLNNTTNGTLVGSVTITKTGDNVNIDYSLLAGKTAGEIHIYASNLAPTTIAPGQYGNTYYFDPKISEYEHDFIIDGTQDVWLIIHSVVAW